MTNQINSSFSKISHRQFHTAIIGAGIGGLIAALELANKGFKVVVLEKHSLVGGYLTSFKRKGFIFDAGANFITGADNAYTPVGNMFKNYGIQAKYVKIEYERFHFGNDEYKVIYNEMEFKNVLTNISPADEYGISEFFRLCRKVYASHSRKGMQSERLRSLIETNYQNIIDNLINNRCVKALLSSEWSYAGLPPSKLSGIIMCMLMHEMMNFGVYQIFGGVQNLSNAIAKKIIEFGGEIYTGSSVEKIIINDKRIKGVLIDGKEIEAKYVVSNADALKTYHELIGDKYLGKSFITTLNTMKESISAFIMYLGVTINNADAEKINGWYYTGLELNDTKNNIPIVISVPSLRDSCLAPPGNHVIIIRLIPDLMVNISTNESKEELKNFSIDTLDHIGQRMGLDYKLSDRIVVKESADSKTFLRYTGNSRGAMYGWEKSPQQLKLLDKMSTELIGFHHVGHWATVGSGLSASIASGILVGRKICNESLIS